MWHGSTGQPVTLLLATAAGLLVAVVVAGVLVKVTVRSVEDDDQ